MEIAGFIELIKKYNCKQFLEAVMVKTVSFSLLSVLHIGCTESKLITIPVEG